MQNHKLLTLRVVPSGGARNIFEGRLKLKYNLKFQTLCGFKPHFFHIY